MTTPLSELASGKDSALFLDDRHCYRVMPKARGHHCMRILNQLPFSLQQHFVPSRLFTGTLNVPLPEESMVLAHKKIPFISYPHEWCALMLKDAALFHLSLQGALLPYQIYLEDAHPWNLLFDKGTFQFVDIDSLAGEEWHTFQKSHDTVQRHTVQNRYFDHLLQSMFIPYFYRPLLGYSFGKRLWVKEKIEQTTLHTATHVMSWRDCCPSSQLTPHNVRRFLGLVYALYRYRKQVPSVNMPLSQRFEQWHDLIEALPVKAQSSPYATYYAEKKELTEYTKTAQWTTKQKTIDYILHDPCIQTVCDVACNTGWYAILAAKLGKKVVAFDRDETCIEALYQEVKTHLYDILPLWSSLLSPTQDRFSIAQGKKVLIHFAKRMPCDLVLALAILHHLILGQGASFETVLSLLATLTKKKLVVEFIEIEDKKIQEEPSFFEAYSKNKEGFQHYTLAHFLEIAKKYFPQYSILPSYPDTRKIILLER